jgi:hypothetical protein
VAWGLGKTVQITTSTVTKGRACMGMDAAADAAMEFTFFFIEPSFLSI